VEEGKCFVRFVRPSVRSLVRCGDRGSRWFDDRLVRYGMGNLL